MRSPGRVLIFSMVACHRGESARPLVGAAGGRVDAAGCSASALARADELVAQAWALGDAGGKGAAPP
jgi:hypothetical protein